MSDNTDRLVEELARDIDCVLTYDDELLRAWVYGLKRSVETLQGTGWTYDPQRRRAGFQRSLLEVTRELQSRCPMSTVGPGKVHATVVIKLRTGMAWVLGHSGGVWRVGLYRSEEDFIASSSPLAKFEVDEPSDTSGVFLANALVPRMRTVTESLRQEVPMKL